MATTQEIQTAVNSANKINKELVQWENRLAAMQQQVKDLNAQKETIQKSIDQKVADAEIAISSKRLEVNKAREVLNADKEKVEEAKKAVSQEIDAMRTEKKAFEKEKETASNELRQAKELRGRVNEFVIATQRAFSVLG